MEKISHLQTMWWERAVWTPYRLKSLFCLWLLSDFLLEIPTSRPWDCTCLIYWYGYGLWGHLEVCETSCLSPGHYLPLKLRARCLSTCAALDLRHLSFRFSVSLWKYWTVPLRTATGVTTTGGVWMEIRREIVVATQKPLLLECAYLGSFVIDFTSNSL